MFFTPEGEILPEYNSGNQKYLYFYGTGSQATLPLPCTTQLSALCSHRRPRSCSRGD